MRYKIYHIVFSCLLVGFFASVGTGATEDEKSLQIYLPREAQVNNEAITLGQVSVIRGPEVLVARANDIALGRLHTRGQEVTLSKAMILGRLSCSGIDSAMIEMSGAEKVEVSSKQQVISGSRFVEAAKVFLAKHYRGEIECQFSPAKIPNDLSISSEINDVRFSASLSETGSNGSLKVRVAAIGGDKELGVRFVDLRVQYLCRQVVARYDIPAGARITEQNTKVESVLSGGPESPDWKTPYGLVAGRNIPAGSVINAGMVRQIKPEILVRRNRHVAVVISRPGLAVTAIGRALEDGHAGEYIKVQMRITDTSRTIIARVNNDGTVEPVL